MPSAHTAGQDGKVCIWKVSPGEFDSWGIDSWPPTNFNPVAKLDVSPRKVFFHPTAFNVLAAASGEHIIELWDFGAPENAKSVLGGHADTIQSIALLATTCRNRKLRLFDPHTGGEPVCVADAHSGIFGARRVDG